MKLSFRHIIPFIILILSLEDIQAQEIQFTASVKPVVRVGEQFRLTYDLNGEGKNFMPPDLSDFAILSGPNPSSSQSIQIINGQVTRTVSNSYTYYLRATKEGDYNIAPATVVVKGQRILSNALKIKVIAVSAQPPPTAHRPSQQQGGQEYSGTVSGDDVFIRASVDNKSPWQGQQVIVTYKIYTKIPISQYSMDKIPSYNSFWALDLMDENQKPLQHNEVIDGQQYVVADIKKVALFPMKNGELTIDPLEVDVVAQVQTMTRRSNDPFFDHFFNDPFFGSNVQNIQKTLYGNALKINVKPLPLHNKPSDFSGAVGQFSFKSNIDRTDLKANEAVNLKFSITGKGNIKLLDNLNVSFPPDFEVYDPKINNNINKSGDGISGARTVEYLIIPRNAGDFTIKPVTFNYFDPDKEDYVTLSSPSFTLDVTKGVGQAAGITYSGVNQSDIEYIGSDIHYIDTHPFVLHRIGSFFFGSIQYILFLMGILLLALISLLSWNVYYKRRSNVKLLRNRKATKVARKRLQKAFGFLKASDEILFYNEIAPALWGYISDKFNISLSELSMDSVRVALESKNVREDIMKPFIATLDHCEYARFAPGDKSVNMDHIYHEALDVITRIERELK
jgi:hypothetical protein